MSKLENSTRSLLQAVYTPVSKDEQTNSGLRQPANKWALIAACKIKEDEVSRLEDYFKERNEDDAEITSALTTIEQLIGRPGEIDLSKVLTKTADVESEALLKVGRALGHLRKSDTAQTVESLERLVEAYGKQFDEGPEQRDQTIQRNKEGFKPLSRAIPTMPGAVVYRRSDQNVLSPAESRSEDPQATEEIHTIDHAFVDYPRAMQSRSGKRISSTLSLGTLLDWAEKQQGQEDDAKVLRSAIKSSGYNAQAMQAEVYKYSVHTQMDDLVNILTAFEKNTEIEPIGFLHLERLSFTPAGIERGELVHSVPLAPGEEVNIAHKEWAHTSEEFHRIVNDFLEDYSEEGVTEKTEIAQSASSQKSHSNNFNVGVSATGGYGPVSITASTSYSAANAASSSESFSRNHSSEVTKKASSRSKREHKVSFRVVSVAGSEDETVRRFKNPYDDRVTRVDYYQLIRKWEVNVHRYGIRFTYDLTIPEPGVDILTKIVEMKALNAALREGFGTENTTLQWARFDLKPSDIHRHNYADIAAFYQAVVPPPPVEFQFYNVSNNHFWGSPEESERIQHHHMEIDVDENYIIDEVWVETWGSYWSETTPKFVTEPVDDFFGVTGKRILRYKTENMASCQIEMRVRAHLHPDNYIDWQLRAWQTIRDAAQARYNEQRQIVKNRLAQLEEELGGQDALSLRRFEREEIMKGVLRWLFGPTFYFVPPFTPEELYSDSQTIVSSNVWNRNLVHGELIKFLHHAIEWENVLYFLYPYFWSHISRWDLKKFLYHPDPTHQAFLKAGSARVVLTIRPGFERDFVSLLETGLFDNIPNNHPYLTIIEEMENYAQTNYPGIPAANPEESNTDGVLIGSWYEYTPTSALDIAMDEELPEA